MLDAQDGCPKGLVHLSLELLFFVFQNGMSSIVFFFLITEVILTDKKLK